MQVAGTKERSGRSLLDQIQLISDAGGSLIQIRTREPMRAAILLREHYAKTGWPYHEWSQSTGFRRFTVENFTNSIPKGDGTDFLAAFELPMQQLRSETSEVRAKADVVHYFVFIDPTPHLRDNPYALDLLQQYATVLPSTNCAIMFITSDAPLDMVPSGLILSADLTTPTVEELEESLTQIVANATADGSAFPSGHDIGEASVHRIAVLGLGLTAVEFETHVALSLIRASRDGAERLTPDYLIEGISNGKTEVVRSSEILELAHPEDLANVGGMARLKAWVAQRSGCYSDEAQEFGIEPPKGLVLVGVPGTGKSLAAKAISSVLDVPLVRLDFARVFSKYVGDSEQRVRSALRMVESMAPCVLFVDEIDKGLGGIGSGGDSGTSMRVLGTYLTWLQELKAPVFNMVTANRVNGLPPELLRRGRFDQIFSVGMPTDKERIEVLAIHLRKRGRDIKSLTKADISRFVAASTGYVSAEIESAVKDGLVIAFHRKETFGITHLLEAMRNLVPMSKSHAEQINAIVQWAAENATSVSDPDEVPFTATAEAGQRRVVLTPNKRK